MANGLTIHFSYRVGNLEIQLLKLCGVERIRAYDTVSGRYAWLNIGDSDAMLQRVDATNIRDSHEQVYQSLLTQQQSH